MTGKDIFKKWAPLGTKWIDWIRPVSFIMINDNFKAHEFCNFTIPNINYIKEVTDNTAIIIDLPGNDSIKEGIALGKIGFRPVPIYNGTNEQKGTMATTDNHSIGMGLIWGAFELEKINIKKSAPPVFLLDSNRMHRFKMNDSVFDNSWDVFPQDIPSSEYFMKSGINKIIVRGEECIQKDLNKILYKFQKDGIKIWFTNGFEEPKEIKLKKSNYKN